MFSTDRFGIDLFVNFFVGMLEFTTLLKRHPSILRFSQSQEKYSDFKEKKNGKE